MLRAGLAGERARERGGGARNQNDTRNPQDTGYSCPVTEKILRPAPRRLPEAVAGAYASFLVGISDLLDHTVTIAFHVAGRSGCLDGLKA
jgi:hypothetical protein